MKENIIEGLDRLARQVVALQDAKDDIEAVGLFEMCGFNHTHHKYAYQLYNSVCKILDECFSNNAYTLTEHDEDTYQIGFMYGNVYFYELISKEEYDAWSVKRNDDKG